ncbi:hypothetical protein AGMMS49991_09510 [Spirochaetia bacterium]|nr:hypothetical protein AGMMS49991_09510 [Spirochaetia bacterium]
MKKVFAALILFIIFTADTFAEYNFGFWGKGVFTPLAISGGDSAVSAATTTWGNDHGQGQRPSIGFTLNVYNQSKSVGMVASFQWDGDNPGLGSNANVWVKPFNDIVKLTIGRYEIDDFRGKLGAPEFGSWILPGGVLDEDAIFMRFKANAGAHIAIRPLSFIDNPYLKGLMIEGEVGSNIKADSATNERATRNIVGWSAGDVYVAGQFGIGYQIPNIGLARVQFIGSYIKTYIADYFTTGGTKSPFENSLAIGLNTSGTLNGDYKDANVIEAAFYFDAVENLKVDVGAKFPFKYTTGLRLYDIYPAIYTNDRIRTGSFNDSDSLIVQFPTTVSAAANYVFLNNRLDILFRGDFSFGGKKDLNDGATIITYGSDIGVMVTANYLFKERFRAGLDLAYNHHGFDTIERGGTVTNIGERSGDIATSLRNDFGFAPWVSMNLSGGVIKIGVAVMLPSSGRWSSNTPESQYFSGEPIISIPISVTYSL